jgi:hypothetical protein
VPFAFNRFAHPRIGKGGEDCSPGSIDEALGAISAAPGSAG